MISRSKEENSYAILRFKRANLLRELCFSSERTKLTKSPSLLLVAWFSEGHNRESVWHEYERLRTLLVKLEQSPVLVLTDQDAKRISWCLFGIESFLQVAIQKYPVNSCLQAKHLFVYSCCFSFQHADEANRYDPLASFMCQTRWQMKWQH